MPSKKRPLKLCWTNPDPMAEFLHVDYKILFKNGDGKRHIITLYPQHSALMVTVKGNLTLYPQCFNALLFGHDALIHSLELLSSAALVHDKKSELNPFGIMPSLIIKRAKT